MKAIYSELIYYRLFKNFQIEKKSQRICIPYSRITAVYIFFQPIQQRAYSLIQSSLSSHLRVKSKPQKTARSSANGFLCIDFHYY